MRKPIKAIVLTCDRYRVFTDHMILRYETLWPNHPFVFHIPYQELPPSMDADRVRYIHSPGDIRGTVRSLLQGLDEDEMVYWCIDDKYPMDLDTEKIGQLHDELLSDGLPDIDGLLFCRCRGMWKKKNLTGRRLTDAEGNLFLERNNYSQIWIHQYLRVKVIRHLFDSFPERITRAKEMDQLIGKSKKPGHHRIFITDENFGMFGESVTRGKITSNCMQSLRAYQLQPPVWTATATPRRITMGHEGMLRRWVSRLCGYFT